MGKAIQRKGYEDWEKRILKLSIPNTFEMVMFY